MSRGWFFRVLFRPGQLRADREVWYDKKEGRQKDGIGRKRKEKKTIRYAYRPRHGWRHGYRREKLWRGFLWIFRILLILECIWIGSKRMGIQTWILEKREPVYSTDGPYPENQVFGIGIEPDSGSFFWFRSHTQETAP